MPVQTPEDLQREYYDCGGKLQFSKHPVKNWDYGTYQQYHDEMKWKAAFRDYKNDLAKLKKLDTLPRDIITHVEKEEKASTSYTFSGSVNGVNTGSIHGNMVVGEVLSTITEAGSTVKRPLDDTDDTIRKRQHQNDLSQKELDEQASSTLFTALDPDTPVPSAPADSPILEESSYTVNEKISIWEEWDNFLFAASMDEDISEYSPERHGIVVCGKNIVHRSKLPESYDKLNSMLEAVISPPWDLWCWWYLMQA